jgi:hypothetical protein
VSMRQGLAPNWQKCNNLSRLLHFCEGNKGCAFINDRKLIAGNAGRMVQFLRMEKRKRRVKRCEPNRAMQNIPDIWAIHAGFGINRSLFRTRSPHRGVEEFVIVLLQGCFPVPI